MRATRLFLVYLPLVVLAPFFSANLFAQPCTDDDQDGWTTCDGDCDDADPSVHPGAPELPCDTIDNDCNPATPDIFDADGDGVDCSVDCDDSDPRVLQGNVDPCDTIDNDCDGAIDEDQVCDTTCNEVTTGPTTTFFDSTDNTFDFDIISTPGGYAGVYVVGTTTRILEFERTDPFGNAVGNRVLLADTGDDPAGVEMVSPGFGYSVVWSKVSSGMTFMRLDDQGEPFYSLFIGGGFPSVIDLVWTGTEYGLLWLNNFSLYFRRLNDIGLPTGPTVVVVTGTPPHGPRGGDLTWNGSEFLVAWGGPQQDDGLFLTRISSSGTTLSTTMITATSVGKPAVLWTGSEYGVLWEAPNSPSLARLYFSRFDALGNEIGSPVSVNPAFLGDRDPALAWTGTEYGITWRRGTVRFKTVDSLGGTLTPLQAPANGNPDTPRFQVFWEGGRYRVLWEVFGGDVLTARIGCDCQDLDGDGVSNCDGDCDDSRSDVYPGAPQLCDGINNDCVGSWPTIAQDEADDDGDGFRGCSNECNDSNPFVYPGAPESCNGIDDDCDGLTDEDAVGEDSDGDSVGNLCDNCPADANPDQANADADPYGDACDNCPNDANPTQTDIDADGQGDRCDPDDGFVNLRFGDKTSLVWDAEGVTGWNLYRGDLATLIATGEYTQAPGSHPLASQQCGLGAPSASDATLPGPGEVAFYLATGVDAGVETIGLGTDSAGTPRPHDNACP